MIYWIAFLSVLIAVETVFAGTCLSMFFPPHPAFLVKDLFTTYQHQLQPKRDVLFLRLFMLAGVGVFMLLMRFCSGMTSRKYQFFKYFTLMRASLVSLEAFFLFKYAIYHYPLWQNGFYASLVLSVAVTVFSPEIIKTAHQCHQRLKEATPFPKLSFWLTACGMLLIPLIIWVPDVEGAVARMFAGEHFHHMDWLLMAAGWAHLSGNILGVDNTSRYGIGAPVIASELTRLIWGRFDYVRAVYFMMSVSIIYYWIWFYALRLVLKDTVWAFIAVFLGLRLQFFNIETFPFIFTYPQDTPLRFFGDSLFFLLLILHTQTLRMGWLYLASAVAGFYAFYITGEGLYTMATFYVFLVLREAWARLEPAVPIRPLNARQWALLSVIPWVVLLSCLWLVVGRHIVEGTFWSNQFEYVRFYQAGNSTAPMLGNLTAPFVVQASIAFLLPAVYLFVLVIFLGRLMQKKLSKEAAIAAMGAVFLLISYHYHAMLANNMPSYLRNGVVIALVTALIVKEATASIGAYQRRLWQLACGFLVLVMTVTTHQFLLHPNIFNLARNPMTHPAVSQVPEGRKSYFSHLFISYPDAFKLPLNGLGETNEMLVTEDDFTDDGQLKDFYRKESDYSRDAALIQSLTPADAKAPVVSSFENLILMQAHRRPFFYTYFMVNSQPRRMRKFPVMVLYTRSNLMREINRIDKDKPPYIFVERTFLVPSFSRAYLYDNEDLVDLLSYIFTYYVPYKSGEFLEALKRR